MISSVTFKLCKHSYRIYWYNLSLLLIPVILGLSFSFKDQHALFYVPICTGLSSLILFLNFPSFVIALHSRPVYYDDLIIKDYNEEEAIRFYDDVFRKKYQKVFRTTIAVTSSILVGLTTELWYFRDNIFSKDDDNNSPGQNRLVSFVVVLSILGGLLRIYYGATLGIGKLIMMILKQLKKREQKLLRKQENQNVLYKLTEMGVTIQPDDDSSLPMVNPNLFTSSVAPSTNKRQRQISLNMQGHPTGHDTEHLLQRSRSTDNIAILAFKPNLMIDIFDHGPVSEDEN